MPSVDFLIEVENSLRDVSVKEQEIIAKEKEVDILYIADSIAKIIEFLTTEE